MIGNFVLAGGILWTTLLLTAEAGQNCTGKPPVIDPPALVVKYGGPAAANCSSNYTAEMMGWEARMGAKSEENTQQLVWSVTSTDWSLSYGITCYTNSDEHGQCETHLPITIYKTPDSVTFLSTHTGPLLEGKQYELQCEVQSVAPVNNLIIIWYRGDTELEQSNFPNFTIVGDQSKDVTVTANLNITASKDDHRVPYKCAARLDLNTTEPTIESNTTQLEVYYEPRVVISSQDMALTEGESLELNCTADSNPSSRLQWRHNNKTLEGETNRTLLIESIEMHNDGTYECVASNTKGQGSTKIEVVVRRNYLPWIAILGAIAIVVLLVVIIAIYCSYHKKNKTGAYFLTKFKVGASQNGQVAHANGYP